MKRRALKRDHTMPASVDPRRRLRPQPYPREVAIMETPPLAQICIYESCVILTRREASGAWRSFPISPEALAQALGKLPVSTGLLPSGTIGNGIKDGAPFYVQYIAPRAVALPAEEAGTETVYRFQTPPLIWAGWKTDYRLFALAEVGKVGSTMRLYSAPFPNVYSAGGICWGNVKRQAAGPQTMGTMLKLFLEESRFNGHLSNGKSKAHDANVLRHYATLTVETPYPLDDLVATSVSLRVVLEGSCWGGGAR